MKMEEKIYLQSIENKQRQDDKEVLLMLLPQVYKAMNGRTHNIKGFLGQMESDALRNKVIKILQVYKIPYKWFMVIVLMLICEECYNRALF